MHNEFLTATIHMQDQQSSDSISEKAYQYYDWMDKNEVRLNKEIPNMMKKLERHFKIGHLT